MSARPKFLPMPRDPSDERALLALIKHTGRTLDDLQNLRIRHENRRGAFEREHGLPLPADAILAGLLAAEHEAELALCRLIRTLPLWQTFGQCVRGVGELSFGRLLAEIGDPADRPNVAKLWSYCGYNPARRHRKGMSQEELLACGNPCAKSRCYLIAISMLKTGNRSVYDMRRAQTMRRDDWTLGHKHNDALRIVAKAFLRDLWVAARALPGSSEAHSTDGGAGQ